MRARAILAMGLMAGAAAACFGGESEAPPPASPLRPQEVLAAPQIHPAITARGISFAALPGWEDGDHKSALRAFAETCGRFTPLDPRKDALLDTSGQAWARACREAQARAAQAARAPVGSDDASADDGGAAAGEGAALTPTAARRFFELRFAPYLLRATGEDAGVVTGYYEPVIDVRATAIGPFDEPLLPRPADLVTRPRPDGPPEVFQQTPDGALRPYPDRVEIVAEAREPLAWGRRSDVLFLQIQGSGRVRYADGQIVRASWDGTNGKPYRSVPKQLVALGLLPQGIASNTGVKRWLDVAGPDAAAAVVARNPRYVFFKFEDLRDPGAGPVGAAGVSLRAGVSLAVDPQYHSYGGLYWIAPQGPGAPGPRFGVAQDAGAAITGPLRGDLFFGVGPDAEEQAARVRHQAAWYALAPRVVASGAPQEP